MNIRKNCYLHKQYDCIGTDQVKRTWRGHGSWLSKICRFSLSIGTTHGASLMASEEIHHDVHRWFKPKVHELYWILNLPDRRRVVNLVLGLKVSSHPWSAKKQIVEWNEKANHDERVDSRIRLIHESIFMKSNFRILSCLERFRLVSSVGRASDSRPEGREFKSLTGHLFCHLQLRLHWSGPKLSL